MEAMFGRLNEGMVNVQGGTVYGFFVTFCGQRAVAQDVQFVSFINKHLNYRRVLWLYKKYEDVNISKFPLAVQPILQSLTNHLHIFTIPQLRPHTLHSQLSQKLHDGTVIIRIHLLLKSDLLSLVFRCNPAMRHIRSPIP